jgi:hypothetical protein
MLEYGRILNSFQRKVAISSIYELGCSARCSQRASIIRGVNIGSRPAWTRQGLALPNFCSFLWTFETERREHFAASAICCIVNSLLRVIWAIMARLCGLRCLAILSYHRRRCRGKSCLERTWLVPWARNYVMEKECIFRPVTVRIAGTSSPYGIILFISETQTNNKVTALSLVEFQI